MEFRTCSAVNRRGMQNIQQNPVRCSEHHRRGAKNKQQYRVSTERLCKQYKIDVDSIACRPKDNVRNSVMYTILRITCAGIRISVYMYMYTCPYTCEYTYVYIYRYTYKYMYVHIYRNEYVYVYVCICTYMYTYI